jgi:hypothetical protein
VREEFTGSNEVPEAQYFLDFSAKQQMLQPFSNLHQHYEPAVRNGVARLQTERRLSMPNTRSGGSKRGFAAMDPAKQREIASKGGKASHGGGRKSSSSR